MKTHSNFSDSTFLSANAPVKYMIFQPVDRSYSLVFFVSNIVEKLWIFYDRMNTHSSKVTSTSLVAACFKSVMKLDVIVTEDKPQDENDGCNEQDFFFCEHRWKSYGVNVGSHLSKQLFS